MLTLQECLDFSGLEPEEIRALAEHQGVSDIVAAEMADGLLRTPRGIYTLHGLFREAIEQAELARQRDRVRRIEAAYVRFRARYPMPKVL